MCSPFLHQLSRCCALASRLVCEKWLMTGRSPRQPLETESEGVNLMNAYKQLLPRTILIGSVGLAAILFSTPSCKAQEIAPDHFTETGVQDIYESAPSKVATLKGQQKLVNSQTNRSQTNSRKPGTLKASAKHTQLLPARYDNQTVATERKSYLNAVKNP